MSQDIFQHRNSHDETVTVLGNLNNRHRKVLSHEALEFLAFLHRTMEPERQVLLEKRKAKRERISGGWRPDFCEATKNIRQDSSWRVAPTAPGLKDRRVEITGPVDRKMTVNALNSAAKGWMADFEDASAPNFDAMISGQVNLFDAIRLKLDFTAENGKHYRLAKRALAQMPTINVRPRGLHMDEAHILVDGTPIAASLVDFGLYFFHNTAELVRLGRGPYFYLPKLEHHLEARWWNIVFVKAQDYLGIPQGTIRATVLIETITAAFHMDEILYQLRNHAAGLNAGRWDYIFSIIKTFRDAGEEFLLPDRAEVTMDKPMMTAYTDLLVATCHRRGAHAIGGMSAFIPNKNDAAATQAALDKVYEDKSREARAGFDGSWVAHPDLIGTCKRVYNELLLDSPHQIRLNKREDVVADPRALLNMPGGNITEQGLRTNIEVGLRYIAAWLSGNGAAAINGLMEDAATAEISRSQIWQWVNAEAQAQCPTGIRTVDEAWVRELTDEIAGQLPDTDEFAAAREVFLDTALSENFVDFLTTVAYDRYLTPEAEDADTLHSRSEPVAA